LGLSIQLSVRTFRFLYCGEERTRCGTLSKQDGRREASELDSSKDVRRDG